MNKLKEVLLDHLPTQSSITQGGLGVRSGSALKCACGTEIWAYYDELAEHETSSATTLRHRMADHIMEQLNPDPELLVTAATVRAGDSNDVEIEALWDVAQAYADLLGLDIPEIDGDDL